MPRPSTIHSTEGSMPNSTELYHMPFFLKLCQILSWVTFCSLARWALASSSATRWELPIIFATGVHHKILKTILQDASSTKCFSWDTCFKFICIRLWCEKGPSHHYCNLSEKRLFIQRILTRKWKLFTNEKLLFINKQHVQH